MSEYHFIKEIREQPSAVAETVAGQAARVAELVAALPSDLNRVVLVGCGDPYFASEGALYAFEHWARLPTEAVDGLEFRFWRAPLMDEHTLVVCISQSGMTIQVVEAARLAKEAGASVISVTNSPEGPLAKQSDHLLFTAGGGTYSFPTRTTTTAASALFSLALELGRALGTLSEEQANEQATALRETLPTLMEQALALEPSLQALARSWQQHKHFAFIGTGPGYATARVGAAKINETSRLQAEADELEEYGHLHLFGIQGGTPLLFLAPSERTGERVRAMVEFATGRGHPVAVFCPESLGDQWRAAGVHVFTLPEIDELLSPLLYVIPLQLFAYQLALTLGNDPDRPTGFDNIAVQKMIYTGLLEGWYDEEEKERVTFTQHGDPNGALNLPNPLVR